MMSNEPQERVKVYVCVLCVVCCVLCSVHDRSEDVLTGCNISDREGECCVVLCCGVLGGKGSRFAVLSTTDCDYDGV